MESVRHRWLAAIGALLAITGLGIVAPRAVGDTWPVGVDLRFRPASHAVSSASVAAAPHGTRFNINGYNWGGYVADGPGTIADPHWIMAYAQWYEPAVTCNSNRDLYAPWVGLDGYGSLTVEQTGVATDCFSGTPNYRAWYEMYPAPPVYLSTALYPVGPGDLIEAGVQYGQSHFYLTLHDITRNWIFSTTQNAPGAQRLSAEIIIESPTGSYPNFGHIDFMWCQLNYDPLGSVSTLALDPSSGGVYEAVTSPVRYNSDFTMTYLHQ
jgi:hypothetical protein